MYRSSQNKRCQYSTIIRLSLSRINSFTGIFLSAIVFNSVKVILKLPSPTTDMHILFPFASLDPMQNPRDTPIVPREPEEIICRDLVHVISCGYHLMYADSSGAH